ncbi:MAG: hypothetical protein U0905_02380 [Pirellulales bacterium]
MFHSLGEEVDMPQLSELRSTMQRSSEPIKNHMAAEDWGAEDWVADSRFSASRAEMVEQKLAALQSRTRLIFERRTGESS